jgi:enoyl-CoA hydratase/carnithine racemase
MINRAPVKAEEALRIGLVDEIVPHKRSTARRWRWRRRWPAGALQAQALALTKRARTGAPAWDPAPLHRARSTGDRARPYVVWTGFHTEDHAARSA